MKEPDKMNTSVWNTITNVIKGATQEQRKDFHFLIEYVTIMKNIILSDPNSRKSPIETSKEIKAIFKQLNKAKYIEILKLLNTNILTSKNLETINANRLRRNLEDAQTEKEINEQR